MYPGNGSGVTSSQQSNLDTNKSKDSSLMNDMKKWRPEDPPTSNVVTSIRHSWPYNWALSLPLTRDREADSGPLDTRAHISTRLFHVEMRRGCACSLRLAGRRSTDTNARKNTRKKEKIKKNERRLKTEEKRKGRNDRVLEDEEEDAKTVQSWSSIVFRIDFCESHRPVRRRTWEEIRV